MTQAVTTSAVALNLPETISFDEFWGVGRQLATQKRNIDWMIGDWVRFGQERFAEQLALALPEITDDVKDIRRAAKLAEQFPPHLRNEAVSYDHHVAVADLPKDEALKLLARAGRERWTEKKIRREATATKLQIGQHVLLDEDDWEHRQLIELQRSWNRAPQSVREEFIELAKEAELGEIDA